MQLNAVLFVAFVLILALLPEDSVGLRGNSLLGKRFRFKSKNYPTHYIRHRSYELWLDSYENNDAYQLHVEYDIVPGLSGVGISFRSKNFPNYYIRHNKGLGFLHCYQNDQQYKEEASWIPREGLADPRGVSFESVRLPGLYLRHYGYRLRVDRIIGQALYRNDATWYPVLTKNLTVTGEWSLVYGNDNAAANSEVSITVEEGVTVGTTSTTSVTTQNSWTTSIEAEASGRFFGFGFSLRTMFSRSGSRTVQRTSSNSWTKIKKVTIGYKFNLTKGVPFYLWQYCVYATTADNSYITSKTDIFKETTTNQPPAQLK